MSFFIGSGRRRDRRRHVLRQPPGRARVRGDQRVPVRQHAVPERELRRLLRGQVGRTGVAIGNTTLREREGAALEQRLVGRDGDRQRRSSTTSSAASRSRTSTAPCCAATGWSTTRSPSSTCSRATTPSEDNCFANGDDTQLVADFRPFGPLDRYPSLADYQKARAQDLHSRVGPCASLPAKLDVHALHAAALAYPGTPAAQTAGARGWLDWILRR